MSIPVKRSRVSIGRCTGTQGGRPTLRLEGGNWTAGTVTGPHQEGDLLYVGFTKPAERRGPIVIGPVDPYLSAKDFPSTIFERNPKIWTNYLGNYRLNHLASSSVGPLDLMATPSVITGPHTTFTVTVFEPGEIFADEGWGYFAAQPITSGITGMVQYFVGAGQTPALAFVRVNGTNSSNFRQEIVCVSTTGGDLWTYLVNDPFSTSAFFPQVNTDHTYLHYLEDLDLLAFSYVRPSFTSGIRLVFLDAATGELAFETSMPYSVIGTPGTPNMHSGQLWLPDGRLSVLNHQQAWQESDGSRTTSETNRTITGYTLNQEGESVDLTFRLDPLELAFNGSVPTHGRCKGMTGPGVYLKSEDAYVIPVSFSEGLPYNVEVNYQHNLTRRPSSAASTSVVSNNTRIQKASLIKFKPDGIVHSDRYDFPALDADNASTYTVDTTAFANCPLPLGYIETFEEGWNNTYDDVDNSVVTTMQVNLTGPALEGWQAMVPGSEGLEYGGPPCTTWPQHNYWPSSAHYSFGQQNGSVFGGSPVGIVADNQDNIYMEYFVPYRLILPTRLAQEYFVDQETEHAKFFIKSAYTYMYKTFETGHTTNPSGTLTNIWAGVAAPIIKFKHFIGSWTKKLVHRWSIDLTKYFPDMGGQGGISNIPFVGRVMGIVPAGANRLFVLRLVPVQPTAQGLYDTTLGAFSGGAAPLTFHADLDCYDSRTGGGLWTSRLVGGEPSTQTGGVINEEGGGGVNYTYVSGITAGLNSWIYGSGDGDPWVFGRADASPTSDNPASGTGYGIPYANRDKFFIAGKDGVLTSRTPTSKDPGNPLELNTRLFNPLLYEGSCYYPWLDVENELGNGVKWYIRKM